MTDEMLLKKIAELIDAKVKSQLEPIKEQLNSQFSDIQNIKTTTQSNSLILNSHSATLENQGKDLKTIKRDLKKTNKTLDIVVKMYDERIVQNARDIDKIKTYIRLPSKN